MHPLVSTSRVHFSSRISWYPPISILILQSNFAGYELFAASGGLEAALIQGSDKDLLTIIIDQGSSSTVVEETK